LFGTRNVTPNQQVILFPDGSVAWHGLHACSSSKLLSALRIATSQLRQSPEARQRVHVRNASKLVRRARKDADAYLKLVTELRNSSHLGFWEILPSRQQYSALNERLLRDVTRDMPLESGAHLMATNVPGGLEPIAQKMRDDIEQQRAQIRAQLALDGPLPDLGRVAELDGIKFTDGVERRLSDGTDRVTVLWFFVPGRPSLPTEVAAIELVADELAAQGVRMLGLAAAIEPAASQEAVRSAGVPFPSAPYLYDQTDARAGVTMFPSAVVLDRDGTVVYRSSQKPDRSPRQYIEFAQWVRALLAQPRDA